MNSIQKINAINQKELENNVSDTASWHADYRDTPYVYIGFLPFELEEKDVLTIFSQYGIPTHINLVRDRDSGKSRGFCYLKYEDYRSCVLAIDNLNGVSVLGKKLKVDHVYFQLRDGQNEDDFLVDYSLVTLERAGDVEVEEKKLLKHREEDQGKDPMDDFKDPMDDFKDPMEDFKDPMEDFEDPMSGYLKDKSKASRSSRSSRSGRSSRHEHRSKRSHRDKDRESSRSKDKDGESSSKKHKPETN